MGEVKLIGEYVYENAKYVGGIHTSRYQATASGIVEKIKVYNVYDGNNRVAIFSDSGSLLGESNSTYLAFGQSGYVNLISPVLIVLGSYYWLARQADAYQGHRYRHGRTGKSKAYTYGAFPSEMGSGWSETDHGYMLEGYGTLATGGTGRLIGGKSPLIGSRSSLIGGKSKLIG